jgi:imidazoleglycerol-phosphate dehydratase
MRTAAIQRKTSETDISVQINLDGSGQTSIQTGVGFFDHMLEQLGRHTMIDMTITATGDTHIDDHHTVEDVGIALGMALKQAVGDKAGIRRYGMRLLPMDEALARVALDLSGRPFLVWNVTFEANKIGSFDTELVREFFTAFSSNAGMTLNIEQITGINAHHIAESIFKGVAQALREAIEIDPRRQNSIPSTKGVL